MDVKSCISIQLISKYSRRIEPDASSSKVDNRGGESVKCLKYHNIMKVQVNN